MKFFQAVVPWIAFAASILFFVVGNDWARMGRLIQEGYSREPDTVRIGNAIASIGFIIKCISGIGVLMGVAFLWMTHIIKKCERHMRRLEEELVWLRQSLPVFSSLSSIPNPGDNERTSSLQVFTTPKEK